jgi:hypothetical protein
MVKRRRRFKQSIPFKDRVEMFANDLREKARTLDPGKEKAELLKRARCADNALEVDEWANSGDLQPPPKQSQRTI